MQTTGPFAVNLQTPVTLEPPSGGIRMASVVIANASPFACAVKMSGSGPAQWLQAWSSDLYVLGSGDIPTVTPTFDTDTTGLITAGQITATWYALVDAVTGSYPAQLNAQAVAAAISGQVINTPNARLVASGTSAGSLVPVALQATDRALILLVVGFNAQTLLSAVGVTSGFDYATLVNATGSSISALGLKYIPVFGGIDSQVNISLGAAGAANSYWILATPDQLVDGIQGQPASTREQTGASSAASLSLTTGVQNLLVAPPGGRIRKVDTVSFVQVAAGQQISLGINTNIMGSYTFTVPANPLPFAADWRIIPSGAGLFVASSANAGFICVSYHDS